MVGLQHSVVLRTVVHAASPELDTIADSCEAGRNGCIGEWRSIQMGVIFGLLTSSLRFVGFVDQPSDRVLDRGCSRSNTGPHRLALLHGELSRPTFNDLSFIFPRARE